MAITLQCGRQSSNAALDISGERIRLGESRVQFLASRQKGLVETLRRLPDGDAYAPSAFRVCGAVEHCLAVAGLAWSRAVHAEPNEGPPVYSVSDAPADPRFAPDPPNSPKSLDFGFPLASLSARRTRICR